MTGDLVRSTLVNGFFRLFPGVGFLCTYLLYEHIKYIWSAAHKVRKLKNLDFFSEEYSRHLPDLQMYATLYVVCSMYLQLYQVLYIPTLYTCSTVCIILYVYTEHPCQ
jgi:hypothetical protein